jgi:hypothetical protein
MKQQTRFSQKQEHSHEQQTESQTGREFANSDDLLGFDASQTNVPPEIAQRLQKSSVEIQAPKSRSWWKNLFGG